MDVLRLLAAGLVGFGPLLTFVVAIAVSRGRQNA